MSDPASQLRTLGADLRARRETRGWTQAELARHAGLPRAKVLQVEAGMPTVSALAYARVAAQLDLEFKLSPAARPTLDEIQRLLDEDEHG